MRILPVLDLMHGQVVRGIGGRRHEYQPLRSPLVSSPDPLAVARAFRHHFGLTELYLADLDVIAGAMPAAALFSTLQSDGFDLIVDAGLRTASDAAPLVGAKVSSIVAGLETLVGLEAVAELVKTLGPSRLVFSLDLRDGRPVTPTAVGPNQDPWEIATRATAVGARRILVLDLARVGVGSGTGTEEFCARLKKENPDIEVLAGGGVRDREDLKRLRRCGVDSVLVASALHDGFLRREDLF